MDGYSVLVDDFTRKMLVRSDYILLMHILILWLKFGVTRLKLVGESTQPLGLSGAYGNARMIRCFLPESVKYFFSSILDDNFCTAHHSCVGPAAKECDLATKIFSESCMLVPEHHLVAHQIYDNILGVHSSSD